MLFVAVTDNQNSYDPLLWRLLSSASKKIDCCLDPLPELGSSSQPKELMEFLTGPRKKKELKLRIIANITKDNLAASKQLLKYADLYHAEGIIAGSSFYIIDDSAYVYLAAEEETGQKGKQLHRVLLSKHPQFIRMQQYLLENLVSRAIPAKEKISGIERGIRSEFIETIREPSRMLHLAKELVRSSAYEILVLFSTINSFYRAENDGILDLLGEASSRGVGVRVLVKIDDESMKDASKQKIKQKHDRINVAFIEKSVRSKITTFIIDQTYSLAAEVGDDSKNTFSAATGLSTYSNSESTVFTYYCMFENLWIQAELERQSKVKHAYFHIFKGQKLRNEVYKRDWASGGAPDKAD